MELLLDLLALALLADAALKKRQAQAQQAVPVKVNIHVRGVRA